MAGYLLNPTCWIVFVGTLCATLVLTPRIIELALRLGVVDRGGYRKINENRIALMGGLAIAIPFIAVCIFGILDPTGIFASLKHRQMDFALLAIGGLAVACLGLIDDLQGVGPRDKFLVQIMAALLICSFGHTITALDLPVIGVINLGAFFGTAVTVVWIVGLINAINLVDGVDGLASGLALIGALGLAAIGALNDQTFVVILSLALAGSLAGFLFFNFHPARIFLGDTGSLFIGFVLAAFSLMASPSSKAPGALALLAPLLALGFPIFDTISSALRRILRGRHPFIGDQSHTHHRLLEYGYSQRQVAIILYGVAAMCTVAAIVSQIWAPNDTAVLLAVGLYGTVIIGLAWANGYLRLQHVVRIAKCRDRNARLAAFTRYSVGAFNSPDSGHTLEDIMKMGCKQLDLRSLEVSFDSWPEPLASASVDGAPSDPSLLDSVKVRTPSGRLLQIRYQLSRPDGRYNDWDEETREAQKLERQDIAACLAHLFEKIGTSLEEKEFIAQKSHARKATAAIHE